MYFSWVRDVVGLEDEVIDPPEFDVTLRDLSAMLSTRSEGHARAFANLDKLRCAVDLVMVGFESPIMGAKEIAFFPPVTGG